jgi:hypothetical protein
LEAAIGDLKLEPEARAKAQEAYDLFLRGPKHYGTLDKVKELSGLYGTAVRDERSQVSSSTTAERLGQWLIKHWPKERLQALVRYLMEYSE